MPYFDFQQSFTEVVVNKGGYLLRRFQAKKVSPLLPITTQRFGLVQTPKEPLNYLISVNLPKKAQKLNLGRSNLSFWQFGGGQSESEKSTIYLRVVY